MSKIITYRCNVCGEVRDLIPNEDTIFGVNFLGGVKSGWLNLGEPAANNNHVCRYCAGAISREYERGKQHLRPPVTESKVQEGK